MDFETHLDQANRETQRFLNRTLQKLRKYLWLIATCVILAVIIAFSIVRYSTRVYSIGAKLLIETSSQGIDTRAFLFDEQPFSNAQDLQNELIIIKSFPILTKTIRDVDHNVRYYRTTKALERVIEIEREDSPFQLKVVGDWVETNSLLGGRQIIVRLEGETVTLLTEDEKQILSGEVGSLMTHEGNTFRIVRNPELTDYETEVSYMFRAQSVELAVLEYQSRLNVEISMERSTIVDLQILGQLTDRETRFIEQLISNYVNANLGEKNRGASNTIEFINEELQIITDSLKKIEGRLQAFKSRNQIGNLQQEGQRVFELLLEMEEENAELKLREKYLSVVKQYLDEDELSKLVTPSSFGIEDPALSRLTSELLTLESERKVFGADSESEIARQMDTKIKDLREALANYVKNVASTNQIQMEQVRSRMKLVESTIEDLPVSEMALMNIERLHKLSESLYLLLLEKKTEAEISKSSNTPDIKVVEHARKLQISPVEPNKRLIYLSLIFLGLALPLAWIVISVWADKTIHSKEEVVEMLDLPFMGYIPAAEGKQAQYILNAPKSRLAEAFRTLRSNAKYLITMDGGKVILVTSCFPGEGKTFVSSNLAVSSASANVKTILIGGDLRKPQIQNKLDLPNDVGLSSYLAGRVPLEDVIQNYQGRLDVITSGPIPPNPMELLDSERFSQLLDHLRSKYDMIIVDTSPFMLVSDAQVLFEKTDMNLIVLRSQLSKRQNLGLIKDLVESHANEKFSIVLNDLAQDHGYGYGYGYASGYYEDGETKKL